MRVLALAAAVAMVGCGEDPLPQARVEMVNGEPLCVGATWQDQRDRSWLCRWDCAAWKGRPYRWVEAWVAGDGSATVAAAESGRCR